MTHVRYAPWGARPGAWHVERRTTGGQVQTACGQWFDRVYAKRTEQPAEGDLICRATECSNLGIAITGGITDNPEVHGSHDPHNEKRCES